MSPDHVGHRWRSSSCPFAWPATLKGWGGKAKRPTIPVAWTEIGKAYVSFHLMGLEAVSASISPGLKTHLQGKTCFNFSAPRSEPCLALELE